MALTLRDRFGFVNTMKSWLAKARVSALLLIAVLTLATAQTASANPFPPAPGFPVGLPFARRLLAFTMQINPNGVIDTSGRGYYIIEFNTFGRQIECTDLDTFSDFVRFDGRNFDWFHRQAQLPRPGFQFFQAANLNIAGRITNDARGIEVIFDLGESTNILNQFVNVPSFSVHALTCDSYRGAVIGRPIDTLGQGPDFGKNSLQTLRVSKNNGVTVPLPQFYPSDPIGDFITQPELPADFPYNNFDISRFEATLR